MNDRTPDWVKHPGYLWTEHASCRELYFDENGEPDKDAVGLFFVEAGHVIDEDVKVLCRQCPVRRECLIHAFTGDIDGKPISAGYFAGFSQGQRKKNSFDALYSIVEAESGRYRREDT